MKRRDFLASLAALSLITSESSASPTKNSNKTTSSKSKSSKSKKSTSSASKRHKKIRNAPPPGPTVHTAEDPITENPPVGTSASRLPPVKAPEPPTEWHTYEITTTINLLEASGLSKLWIPLPLNQDTLYQRTLGHGWKGNPTNSSLRRQPDGALEVFYAEWKNSEEARLQLKTLVTTADRHFDITKRTVAPEREDLIRYNLRESKLIPNDGLAFQLGQRIIGRIKDPVAQAKAVYDWVIDNSIYDPNVAGCGTGNVRHQMTNGQYGGKSADINGLFVSICRAVGIPARCVYGLRVAPSRLFKSLGLVSSDATSGQHVRAEFYVPGYGWIPVDPSDVRRAIALEGISNYDPKLASLNKILFGVWEMNWVAFNVGTDISAPGQTTRSFPFFLFPQLESGNTFRDGIENTLIAYTITTQGVTI